MVLNVAWYFWKARLGCEIKTRGYDVLCTWSRPLQSRGLSLSESVCWRKSVRRNIDRVSNERVATHNTPIARSCRIHSLLLLYVF